LKTGVRFPYGAPELCVFKGLSFPNLAKSPTELPGLLPGIAKPDPYPDAPWREANLHETRALWFDGCPMRLPYAVFRSARHGLKFSQALRRTYQ
jgi:hypothetical protein